MKSVFLVVSIAIRCLGAASSVVAADIPSLDAGPTFLEDFADGADPPPEAPARSDSTPHLRAGLALASARSDARKFAAIRPNGYCNKQYDDCVEGYDCIQGQCWIPSGGACGAGDFCAAGYDCIGGRCGVNRRPVRRVVSAGETCDGVDLVCQDGLSCVSGVCIIEIGGPCTDQVGQFCADGSVCNCGRCKAISGTCTENCNCASGDCGRCQVNCNCAGDCFMPYCKANCLCNGLSCNANACVPDFE